VLCCVVLCCVVLCCVVLCCVVLCCVVLCCVVLCCVVLYCIVLYLLYCMLDLQTRRELGKGVEGARVLNAHPLDPIALSTLPNLPLLSNCLFVNIFASTKRCIAPKFICFVFLLCLSRRIPLQELDLVANEMWKLRIKKSYSQRKVILHHYSS